MAPLVRDGRDRLVVVVVVDEQERVHVVGVARHVRAGQLLRARVDVHPAVRDALLHRGLVLGAQRRHRLDHHPHALVDRIRAPAGDERGIDVVVAHLGHTQHLPAQAEVAVQRGQVGVGRLDERVVDGARQVVRVERRGHRVRVLAHLGVDAVLLQVRVERRADGGLEHLPLAEEGVHHLLAVVTVRGRAVVRVRRLVELHFLASAASPWATACPRWRGCRRSACLALHDPNGADLLALRVERMGGERGTSATRWLYREPRRAS